MSRSGYSDDYGDDDPLALGRRRQAVRLAITGKRGQAFLRELAAEMDAMPVKELIADTLIDANGCCCTMGVVCKARGVNVSEIEQENPDDVAEAIGLAPAMVQEIAYENDECGRVYREGGIRCETNAERWARMRKWVARQIKETP